VALVALVGALGVPGMIIKKGHPAQRPKPIIRLVRHSNSRNVTTSADALSRVRSFPRQFDNSTDPAFLQAHTRDERATILSSPFARSSLASLL
jgi:hypothetical protein